GKIVQKVSKSRFPRNRAKFSRLFKGRLESGNVAVRILPGQPATHPTYDSVHLSHRKPAKTRAFLRSARCLQTPKKSNQRENLPKVSSRYLKYSRFRETFGGDFFRSALSGRGGRWRIRRLCERPRSSR